MRKKAYDAAATTSTASQATSESRDRLVAMDETSTLLMVHPEDETSVLVESNSNGNSNNNRNAGSGHSSGSLYGNRPTLKYANDDNIPFHLERWYLQSKTCGWSKPALAIVLAAVVLFAALGVCVYHTAITTPPSPHTKENYLETAARSSRTSTSFRDKTSSVDAYDYIVVGAGPSGIITAVKLARLLPQQTVLLVEAGTTSQASVLANLDRAASDRRRRRTSDKGIHATASSCTLCNSRRQQQQQGPSGGGPMVVGGLNQFDVPLLWSGVAASGAPEAPTNARNRISRHESITSHQDNSRTTTTHPPPQQQQRQPDHHWPVGRTLLGKNIGGSGVHNAMVYIRSLATDWDAWNISGWDYHRDILPEYIRLERYIQQQQQQQQQTMSTSSPFVNFSTRVLRGYDGPMVTMRADPNNMDAIAPLFVQSAIRSGIPSKVETGFNDEDDTIYVDDQDSRHHKRIGVGYYEFNIRHGVRDSVAQAFLGHPSNGIPDNLFIESGVTVTRVLFETDDPKSGSNNPAHHRPVPPHPHHAPRAIGVEYVRTDNLDDSVCTESTKTSLSDRIGQFHLRDRMGEVILAAGAILTPQLLVNSGIGDRENASMNGTTSSSSVPITIDLPGVGKNLHDHPVVTIGFEIDAEIALMGSASSIYTIGNEMEEYYWSAMELNRMDDLLDAGATQQQPPVSPPMIDSVISDLAAQLGALGTPGFSAGAFLRSPYADVNDPSPDIQLTVFPRHMEPHVARQKQQPGSPPDNLLRNKAMLITVALLKPQARFKVNPSRSSIPLVVQLEDDDDDVDPVAGDNKALLERIRNYRLPEIDLPDDTRRYLTDHDVQRLAWGLEEVRRIQAEAPLSHHTGPEIYPGIDVQGAALRRYVREKSLPNAHWAGTTRMSNDNDDDENSSMAVVDARLRVRKVSNLRIVDAGVLPAVPNGNIHSTVCVIASRAATMIATDRATTSSSAPTNNDTP